MADWSTLPEELLNLIAVRLFSIIEHKRFRSICKPWRSSVSDAGNNNLFPSQPFIHLDPNPSLTRALRNNNIEDHKFVSRAAFFRVTLSSSSSQGWLIKANVDINSGKACLLEPLSRLALQDSGKSLDLLEFTVSEIHESYAVQPWCMEMIITKFKRVVLPKVKKGGDNHNCVLGIGLHDKMIQYWNGKDWKAKPWGFHFSDIIVHKGLTYALDSKGLVWWISSDLEICTYGPPLDENITDGYGYCGNKSFVECGGELYIVDRFLEEENPRKRKGIGSMYTNVNVGKTRTLGFKVYKFDEELGKMVEVKSLGDYAFVMATDTCFSVLAHEYYGCLKGSIYFTDDEKEIKVFKLDNCIPTMLEVPQSFFQMFVPSFLWIIFG